MKHRLRTYSVVTVVVAVSITALAAGCVGPSTLGTDDRQTNEEDAASPVDASPAPIESPGSSTSTTPTESSELPTSLADPEDTTAPAPSVAQSTTTLALTSTLPRPTLATEDTTDWRLVLNDDFAGTTLSSLWNTCHWWQVDGGCTIITNDELQWYRPEGVSVRDGALRLLAEAIPQQATDGRTLPYRSGMVTTGRTTSDMSIPPKFAFTYGFVEAAMTLPTAPGTWPALWLLSADNTSLPEIDIMEWYGRRPELITMHVHQRVDGNAADTGRSIEVADARGSTHVFGMRWTTDGITFYLDGVESGSVTDPAFIPTTPMYLIMNLAIGGGNAGTPDATQFPQELAVDYIRVWQEAP